MAKKVEQDASQPKVEVRIPKVNLRVDDLAYLRGLATSNGVRCHIPHSRLSRLRLLGLIEKGEIPPCPKQVKQRVQEFEALQAKATKLVKSCDWVALSDMSYSLKRAAENLKPRMDDVLTDAGRSLLLKGEVVVRMKKAGCA